MNDRRVQIHDRAIVETENIGDGTRVWAFSHVLKGAVIGTNCNVCEHCFIENDVELGDNVTVKSGVYLWNGIRVEDNVFLGPNATFTNDKYPRSKVYERDIPLTFVKEGASVGAGSIIMAGVTIGRYAMVGAGAIVTKDVKDYEIVYGSPAKGCGYICACKEKMDFSDKVSLKCKCKRSYVLENGSVIEK